MSRENNVTDVNPEITAISVVYEAVRKLESEAQTRVLNYVARMLKISFRIPEDESSRPSEPVYERAQDEKPGQGTGVGANPKDGLEGISPVAQKWIMRNGLSASAISSIFSLGGDEIDLIAKEIPGKSKRDRMHSVVLLKGVAAYLGSGAARFTHQQLKEACLHYKAYDSANFATYLKGFGNEVTGDKSTAYTLNARGLASATEMVRGMAGGASLTG
jgi:hypothetical protein